MTEAGTRDSALRWEVFVTPGIPTVASDLAPGTKHLMWSPISSTLVYGKRDAVAPRQKSKRPMKAHHPCLEKLLIQFLFRFEISVSELSDHSREAIKAPR